MKYFEFIPQYKGKDIEKVPKSKLLEDSENWYLGAKFDGQYTQIHKLGNKVVMFTSDGHPFIVKSICDALSKCDHDFIIEAEFNGKGSTGVLLNDRVHSSLTTHTTKYKKGLESDDTQSVIHVFDMLKFVDNDLRNTPFGSRTLTLKNILSPIVCRYVRLVKFTGGITLSRARQMVSKFIANGGEGGFAFHGSHTIRDKGRSNYAVKIKNIKTMFGICVDCKYSDTVPNEYGALVLNYKIGDKLYSQSFGGLKQEQRRAKASDLLGKTFEFKYEQINEDGKIIQGFII